MIILHVALLDSTKRLSRAKCAAARGRMLESGDNRRDVDDFSEGRETITRRQSQARGGTGCEAFSDRLEKLILVARFNELPPIEENLPRHGFLTRAKLCVNE
ncbi:uncharacterized protein LAESUDRAFT_498233 [Laetiporus sulphureus 93-53]|uniref:Uncharacterized protein n=1 Tax=Laetiporus sulphureus 93-53 TaxID=1314785 RepID=A0A165BHF3_9APHY|nr:uncharacterized protein LAESUDRAFT_498233 [Laetiporus sulphureus 93-53]KZT01061.1 hypothetical protein LAESUDRAFT_498233 [Laetiporus sulphureus 93-53]